MRTIEKQFNLNEERLCLDFANTAEFHISEHPVEHLNTYADLVEWGKRKGLYDETAGDLLMAEAERHPAQAEETLQRAIRLREATYEIFASAANNQAPTPESLEIFNTELSRLMGSTQLSLDGEGFQMQWQGDKAALDQMLGEVLLSAIDLLTSEDLARVGQCADDRGCGWLFIDRSKNHSRQWCDMNDCGNRAKAKRHYQKVKLSM